MIYKIFIVDADNGISLLETVFKEFGKQIEDEILTGFFNAINRTIDNIQAAMSKGRRINEMTRVLESEDSTIMIFYHPLARVLFCSVSDADDDTDKIREMIHKIGTRFWKKHQSDLKVFRTTTEKTPFITFKSDIENISMGGRIAEVFPKKMVVKRVLEKILSMGMITDFDYQIAMSCSGKNSPLKIARLYGRTRNEINEVLKKLEELDIIKIEAS
ncbi:MAG: hypothetical protein ACTSR8_11690 [Promethearchaeota archaeon]